MRRAVRLRLLWELIRGQITHFVSPEQPSKGGGEKKRKRGEKTRADTHVQPSNSGMRRAERPDALSGDSRKVDASIFSLPLPLEKEKKKKNLYATRWEAAELRSYWSVRLRGGGAMMPTSQLKVAAGGTSLGFRALPARNDAWPVFKKVLRCNWSAEVAEVASTTPRGEAETEGETSTWKLKTWTSNFL